ncbi:MAG TPA: hypothetical protein VFV19_00690 [Candidatus Polarisedimenticolaceae bacterium]|nr:hypothetical protein [Candidatus Polarisedimenticolaceae bacterium]
MTLPIVISMISTTAIVTGVFFALLQLRLMNRQRARESALQMLHSFRTPDFLEAINIVFDLPENLSRRELEERLGNKMQCILVLFGTFESLGILVYRRDIDIEMVEDFSSGILILSGRKLRRYIDEYRKTGNRETYYEWYQWLHEQVARREAANPSVPAFVAHKDWRE